jgi:hypothetical protein
MPFSLKSRASAIFFAFTVAEIVESGLAAAAFIAGAGADEADEAAEADNADEGFVTLSPLALAGFGPLPNKALLFCDNDIVTFLFPA